VEKEFVNSLGMRLMRIEAGSFRMGADEEPLRRDLGAINYNEYPLCGDYDERPVHRVTISRPFYMAVCPVTNAQYEQFDPSHRALRGKLGFSREDDEAVVFVSWYDAVRFCEWLSRREGKPYRLPTEAEWEYACRAGTTTPFWTGDTLPEVFHRYNRLEKWKGTAWYPAWRSGEAGAYPADLNLAVGRTPPNPWGLYDMHGLVEEWCYDWYGPYEAVAQVDPVGRADGEFKVTRGGSHSTDLYYLRSANRLGAPPDDKHWLIGFRVVMAEMPQTKPLPPTTPAAYQLRVAQRVPPDLTKGPDPQKPYFRGPRRYVKIPFNACGPLYYRHNHDPAICVCPNGDLLAIWYSCIDEPGRELCLAVSRLRRGEEEWEEASPFWDPPDRNCHAPALWYDGEETIYHFCGLSVAGTWGNLALIMRTSRDNGVTWSKPRFIEPEHGPVPRGAPDRMPIPSVFRAQDGTIVLPSDAGHDTALYLSRDNGKTWHDAGGRIAGIHAGVAQLQDGRLLAFGRGGGTGVGGGLDRNLEGMMPMSISEDMGRTWSYGPSPFPSISFGQRLVLMRLREGPLLFVSFAGRVMLTDPSGKQRLRENGGPLTIVDAVGNTRRVSGMFAALSDDEGETWPVRKLIVPDGVTPHELELTYGTRFTMDACTAEPQGYLAACQASDGVIHLITSQRHYAFNLAWLRAPMPAHT